MGRKRNNTPDPRVWDMIQSRMKGETLQQIAERYNITRERVRQILKPAGAIELRGPTLRQRLVSRKRFAEQMKRWMWSIGVRKCSCGVWSDKVTDTSRRCPECNRKAAREAYLRGYKETMQRWARANKDKVREYQRRWAQRHPEKAREYHAKLKSTEEGRARLREAWRKAKAKQAKVILTEEGRAKLRERWREAAKKKYYRDKERARQSTQQQSTQQQLTQQDHK